MDSPRVKLIGKSRQAVSKFRAAAEVYEELHNSSCEVDSLMDKATHLFEIHSASHDTRFSLDIIITERASEHRGGCHLQGFSPRKGVRTWIESIL